MNAKTWQAIEQIFNTLINNNYRDEEESADSWENVSSIEIETIPQLWEDAARVIGLPYRLQLTIDNMELRYETMDSLFVLLDGNVPFFAIPFQEVVSSNNNHYSGLKKEGMKAIVEAALSRSSLQHRATSVVEVFENGETVSKSEAGHSVLVVNHNQLKREFTLVLEDRFDHLRESEFVTLWDVVIKTIAGQMKQQKMKGFDVAAALSELDLKAAVQEAGLDEKVLNIWACPNGCDIEVVLICGGPWGDDPNGKNRYFQAKLNGAYTCFDEYVFLVFTMTVMLMLMTVAAMNRYVQNVRVCASLGRSLKSLL